MEKFNDKNGIAAFRFLSLRHQLMLEAKGMRSSGGPLRPRLQPQPEFCHLQPRSPRAQYIAACEKKLADLGHPDYVAKEKTQ